MNKILVATGVTATVERLKRNGTSGDELNGGELSCENICCRCFGVSVTSNGILWDRLELYITASHD